MEEYRIETVQDSQPVIQFLEEKLYEHNANKINRHDGCLFSRVIRGKNGDMIAGIAGWTWAGACEITQLWVRENLRKSGIGKKLLRAAEEEAKSKGCSIVLVRTYSFQAPSFYESCGYKTGHVIDNFPDGYLYYSLTKVLQ